MIDATDVFEWLGDMLWRVDRGGRAALTVQVVLAAIGVGVGLWAGLGGHLWGWLLLGAAVLVLVVCVLGLIVVTRRGDQVEASRERRAERRRAPPRRR